jgi:hypothetical protein
VIARSLRRFAAPRLAWVLWLAMLLPLAQLAANWHAQSHWDTERTSSPKDSLAAAHCVICLGAAAVTGGGATSTPLVIAHAPPRQPVAQLAEGPRWSAPSLRAYQSRAPPLPLA